MIVTQSVRLFPTKKQEKYFHKACSARTHIFNKAKEWDDLHYEETGERLTKRELTELIAGYKPEFHKDLPFTIEHHTYRDGMHAYFDARRRAFAKKGGWPKYQSNKYRRVKSFYVRTDGNREFSTIVEDSPFVSIAGLSKVDPNRKYVLSDSQKRIPYYSLGIKSARVVWDGKYWSLQYTVDVDLPPVDSYTEPIGLDLGLANYVTDSNGITYDSVVSTPKYQRLQYRVKHYQRKLDRQRTAQKSEGREVPSKGYWRTRTKLQKVERDLAEYKKSFEISLAKEILKDNPSTVVMENLSIKVMQSKASKGLSSSIHRARWYSLRLRIKHEQDKIQGTFILADKYYPSTRKCSSCGAVKEDSLPLSVRVYSCSGCGMKLDRDLNAALNLKSLAYA